MLAVQFLGVLTAFFILYLGAEVTLNSSEKLGKAMGLSPLAIGVLIIGFGTSLPEFFVSQIAAWDGSSSMAIGNLIGSNIANSLLILGIASMFTSIPMRSKNLWGQLVFHIVLHGGLLFLLAPPELDFKVKLGLLSLFIVYIVYSILNDIGIEMSKEDKDEEVELRWSNFFLFILGMGMLFLGGELLISQGTEMAITLGVSEYLISVIFISFGTSFPELVTAIVACCKKKDLSLVVGNIIGSNFFNLSFVLGSLIIYKVEIIKPQFIELSVLCSVSVLFFIFKVMNRIPRLASIPLLGGYGIMVYYWIKQG